MALSEWEIKAIMRDVMAEVEMKRRIEELIEAYNKLEERIAHIEEYLEEQNEQAEPAIGFQANIGDEDDE